MRFETRTTFHSKLFPGVTIHLRKLSHGLRTRIDLALAQVRSEIRDMSEEREEILAPARDFAEREIAAEAPDRDTLVAEAVDRRLSREDKRTVRDLWSKIQLAKASQVEPAYLREAVKSIHGLEVDPEGDEKFVTCADVEMLIEHGPAGLVTEIYDEIQAGVMGLSAEERKN